MENLTDRQKQVLDFITGYLEKYGYPPALRDIAGHLGVNGTFGVMKHLAALEKKGYVRRDSGSSRGVALVQASHSVSLPVVGVVRAGALQPAIEEIEGYFSVDQAHIKGGAFFLRADRVHPPGGFSGQRAGSSGHPGRARPDIHPVQATRRKPSGQGIETRARSLAGL